MALESICGAVSIGSLIMLVLNTVHDFRAWDASERW